LPLLAKDDINEALLRTIGAEDRANRTRAAKMVRFVRA